MVDLINSWWSEITRYRVYCKDHTVHTLFFDVIQIMFHNRYTDYKYG